jgi:hypothetical protein
MYILRVDNVHAAKEARSVEKDQAKVFPINTLGFVHSWPFLQVIVHKYFWVYVSSDIFSNTFSIYDLFFLFYFIKYEFGDQAYRNILNFTT